MVDMKVLVYSNFKNLFLEKQGHGSKNMSAVLPFSQNARPIPKLPHKNQKNNLKISKNCKKRGMAGEQPVVYQTAGRAQWATLVIGQQSSDWG
jgi:hypothetical protein